MGKDLKGKELGNGISQRKDGRYQARFTDRFGKRKSLYGSSASEVRKLLNEAVYEDSKEMNLRENLRLDDWFSRWLDVYKRGAVRATTIRIYEDCYSHFIKPTLGRHFIQNVTQMHIKELLNHLEQANRSFDTRNKVKIMLQDMFDKALVNDFVRKNPVRGIKVVRPSDRNFKVLSREEQEIFFECSKGTFYDNLFVVAVSSGLRVGEIAALTQDSLDFKNKVIEVTRTLVYQDLDKTHKDFYFGPPKTDTSYRKVPMNAVCEKALHKQILQHAVLSERFPSKKGSGFEGLLFSTKRNGPICPQNVSDAIDRILDEINSMRDPLEKIEHFSSHAFRHTFATRCFEAGIKPKTVQAYLGHATLQMTMDLYTTVFEDVKQNEMVLLEDSLKTIIGD